MHKRVLVLDDDLSRAIVPLGYQPIHFPIDLDRYVLAVNLSPTDFTDSERLYGGFNFP